MILKNICNTYNLSAIASGFQMVTTESLHTKYSIYIVYFTWSHHMMISYVKAFNNILTYIAHVEVLWVLRYTTYNFNVLFVVLCDIHRILTNSLSHGDNTLCDIVKMTIATDITYLNYLNRVQNYHSAPLKQSFTYYLEI